jgi:uncharacterized membrane protein
MPGVTVSPSAPVDPTATRPRRPGIRDGWRAFRVDPARLLVPTLVLSLGAVVMHVLLQYLIARFVAGTGTCQRNYAGSVLHVDCGPGSSRALIGVGAGLFVIIVLGHLVAAGISAASLDDSATPAPFGVGHLRPVLTTSVLLGVALTIGTGLLLVPAVVLAFFSRYALLFATDQGVGPGGAILASFHFVGSDLLSELGFVLRALGALLLGVLALGVGLYVAVPVVLAAQAQRYRARNPAAPA